MTKNASSTKTKVLTPKEWARLLKKQLAAKKGPQIRWMRKHGDVLACYLSWDEHELPRMRQMVRCENHCRAKGETRVKLVKVRITEIK